VSQIGTRKLLISVSGVGVTGLSDVSPNVSSAVISVDDSDPDFNAFGTEDTSTYSLDLTMAQDAAAGSLWRLLWDHAGDTCDVLVNPYGVSTPTDTTPHFAGECTIVLPSGALLGGEKDNSTSARFTVEVSWPFTTKPTMVTS
jgi:hypothetical protein